MRLTHFIARRGAFAFALTAAIVLAACSSSSSKAASKDAGPPAPGASVGGCPGVICATNTTSTTCQCISGPQSNLTGSGLSVAVNDCNDALAQPVCCEDPNNDLCYCFSNAPCETGEISVPDCSNALVGNPTAPDSTPPNSCALQN